MRSSDFIIKEVREARQKIELRHDNDGSLIFEAYLKRQKKDPKSYYLGQPVKINRKKVA